MPGAHYAAVLRTADIAELPLKNEGEYLQAPVGLERSREIVARFQKVLDVLKSEN